MNGACGQEPENRTRSGTKSSVEEVCRMGIACVNPATAWVGLFVVVLVNKVIQRRNLVNGAVPDVVSEVREREHNYEGDEHVTKVHLFHVPHDALGRLDGSNDNERN